MQIPPVRKSITTANTLISRLYDRDTNPLIISRTITPPPFIAYPSVHTTPHTTTLHEHTPHHAPK